MQTVSTLTTLELERLQREYAHPKSLSETIMLKGITAEINERWPSREHRNLEDDLAEAQSKRDQEAEENSSLESDIEEKEQKIADLETLLEEKEERLEGMRKQAAAMCKTLDKVMEVLQQIEFGDA